MALSIKTAEADELARELAAATHESITEAVTTALRERLMRVRGQESIATRLDRLIEEYQASPIADHRTVEEILGYDDDGLPA
jgi:antitoxin VapB